MIKLILLFLLGFSPAKDYAQGNITQTPNVVDSTWSLYEQFTPTNTYGNRKEFIHTSRSRIKFQKNDFFLDSVSKRTDGSISNKLLWVDTDGKVKASTLTSGLFTGTSGQYIAGDGSFSSFPSIPDGVPIGVPLDFAGTSAPTGYLMCDGAAVSRATYAALFAVIGTTYGSGDGSTTFNLPDCRQAVVITKAASGTASVLGETGGSIDHVHTVNPPNTTTGTPSGTSGQLVGVINVASASHTHDVDIAQFDSGINNQKYITFNKIIKF